METVTGAAAGPEPAICRVSFAKIVGVLAAAGDWRSVRALLEHIQPLPSERPVFVDIDLQRAVYEPLEAFCENKQKLDTRDLRVVTKKLFPPLKDVAQYVETFAQHASVTQVEDLFEQMWGSLSSGYWCGFYWKGTTEDCMVASLLELLSDATISRLTARSVRMCVVVPGENEEWHNNDCNALEQLLTRRPDLANMLCKDGVPVWFTPDFRALRTQDLRVHPSIDVNMPFEWAGVTGPVLQHLISFHCGNMRGADWWDWWEYASLRGSGARLSVASASTEPVASFVIRLFEGMVDSEDSAVAFATSCSNDTMRINACYLAELGLLVRPADVARMTASLGADSRGLNAILHAFAEQRWKQRKAVMQVLFAATQESGEPDGEPLEHNNSNIRRCTDTMPTSSLLSAVLRVWNTRRAPPLDSVTPFGLCNELAGKVVTFLL